MNNIDLHSYFFELPLYSKAKIISDDFSLRSLVFSTRNVDAYNPLIKENTTYEIRTYALSPTPSLNNPVRTGMYYHSLICKRTNEVFYVFSYIDIIDEVLYKVGQYKSIADFHMVQIKKYKSVLSTERLKEFTRAIGLAANGVGIGSFVYLRRIFEGLIEDAQVEAQKSEGWDDDIFKKQRMADKIQMLKSYLPDFLIENKDIYSVLSIGIHSLTEAECLENYEIVKVGIELILDEKVEKLEKERKASEARKKISDMVSKVKQK